MKLKSPLILPHSNFLFHGIGIDSNGNKVFQFSREGKNIVVQSNGNLPRSHSRLTVNDSQIGDDDLIWLRKELVNYLFKIGEY